MALMLILGTPGLDLFGPNSMLPGSRERAEQLEQPLGWFPVWAADLNRSVREPIVKLVAPLQRPLRLAQAWGLYGRGPNFVRTFEVRVDGELVYRAGDPDYDWHRSVFRYRKIRPILDAHCGGTSKNSRGLSRYIARAARQDWPEAKVVEVSCSVREWDGSGSVQVRQRRRLTGPKWGAE